MCGAREVYDSRVNALEAIAFHPQAIKNDERLWKWEAESMRAIALDAIDKEARK